MSPDLICVMLLVGLVALIILYKESFSLGSTLFVAIFLILAIRSSWSVLLPGLMFEDGRDMLGFFFNSGNPLSVFRFYAGYVSLFPNIIAWVATQGPLMMVPYVFTFASLIFATLGIFLLSRNSHSWLISEPRERAMVALMIALLPLGQDFLTNNLNYSLWSILFLLFVILTRPLPCSTAGLTVWTLSVVLCAFSHPLSFLLVLPLCVVHFVISRHLAQRLCLLVCACTILAYSMFAVEDKPQFGLSLESMLLALKVFLARVSFESLFGANATHILIVNGGVKYVYGLGAMILCVTGLLTLMRRRPVRSALAGIGAIAIAFLMVYISILNRCIGLEKQKRWFNDQWTVRFFYIPKLIIVIMILSQVVPRVMALVSVRRPLVRTVLLGVWFCYLFTVNFDNAYMYRELKTEGMRVSRFLASVAADIKKAKNGNKYVSEHTLERSGWDIVLNIDRHLGRTKK